MKKLRNFELWLWILNQRLKHNWLSTKGQTISKANYGFLNSSKETTKLTILIKKDAQDSEFCLFFGRIEDTIICFRDFLTFNPLNSLWWSRFNMLLTLRDVLLNSMNRTQWVKIIHFKSSAIWSHKNGC